MALVSWLSTFYPFQLDWILDQSRYAVANKSRQIGISHTTAAVGVLWGVFHGELTTVISIGEREAEEVLEKAKLHREILVALGSQMARRRKKDNSTAIDFLSNGRILALPATGGRSFTGNIFLDEHAYQVHEAKVWEAALAVTMHGFRARVASTPNGIGNGFHNLWKNAKALGWSTHEITLADAISQGMRVDLASCWKMAKGDPRLFDQFFRCKFLDGEAQYIPTEAVEACTVPSVGMGAGEFYGGLDIGRTVDLTVLVVVRCAPDRTRWVHEVLTCKRTSSDELEAMVAAAFIKYNLRRVCIDATGMGAFPAERMQKVHGKHRVEPVTFTQDSKEDLATGMYSAFTEATVRIPRSASKLRDDVCAIRRIVTSAGNIRYDAPRTDEGHADRAWALALALHSCRAPANIKHVAPGR